MKHPKLSMLQDYLENELNKIQSGLVKEHLLDCDQCTLILSQIAKVDTTIKSGARIPVSVQTKNRIFADAKNVLQEKRKKIETAQDSANLHKKLFQELLDFLRNMVNEFKAPVFQLASLTLVIGFIFSTAQTKQLIVNKPLSDDVVVYTHGEKDSPLEGDIE